MIFERENTKPICNPSNKILAKELNKLRRHGNSSFACLTDEDGSYVQVAGSGICCLLERRNINQKHYRAYQNPPIVPPDFKDGTILSFSGGEIPLNRNEWFKIDQVIETFCAFNKKSQFPEYINWKEITSIFSKTLGTK
ncbi:MAG: hypothetical protein FD167_4099 [bacterium]|nr:MAG: hypothetical protein FD167_4099 [bacterium]